VSANTSNDDDSSGHVGLDGRMARQRDVLDEPRRRDRDGPRRVRRDRLVTRGTRRGHGGRRTAPARGAVHPEVAHTERGQDLLANFLHHVAGIPPTWTNTSIIEDQVSAIRAQVGTEKVLCALSGGVDSAVAAALVTKAVGQQLTCVFVDTGLMRKNEANRSKRRSPASSALS